LLCHAFLLLCHTHFGFLLRCTISALLPILSDRASSITGFLGGDFWALAAWIFMPSGAGGLASVGHRVPHIA